jgi:hypothetical protein
MPAEPGYPDARAGANPFARLLKTMVSSPPGEAPSDLTAQGVTDLPADSVESLESLDAGDGLLPQWLPMVVPVPAEGSGVLPSITALMQWLVQLPVALQGCADIPSQAIDRPLSGTETSPARALPAVSGTGTGTGTGTAFTCLTAVDATEVDSAVTPAASTMPDRLSGTGTVSPVATVRQGEFVAGLERLGEHASVDLVAGDAAQQMAATAAAAVATVAMTTAGTPVVAPAQTWIQTPVTQPGFSDAVVVELVRRIGQAEQGLQEVTLYLNPEALGPVSVSIELKGNTARIEFGASEALTRHQLEATLPGLAQALYDEGVSLTHAGVHEASQERLAAGVSGVADAPGGDASAGSGGANSGARRDAGVFVLKGSAPTGTPESEARVPVPGRAGRLDLIA